jgi:hypothetical protein
MDSVLAWCVEDSQLDQSSDEPNDYTISIGCVSRVTLICQCRANCMSSAQQLFFLSANEHYKN